MNENQIAVEMYRFETAGQRPNQSFPPRPHNRVYSIHTHRELANPSGSDQRTYASMNMIQTFPIPTTERF